MVRAQIGLTCPLMEVGSEEEEQNIKCHIGIKLYLLETN